MAPPLCEDILRNILHLLIRLEWEDSYTHVESVILNFMMVGRTWLEVGRRFLYENPDIRESSDSVHLFQTSILHLNHDLGSYVQNFQARGVGVGPLMLARMVSLMPNLQTLEVDSMDFVDHYPDSAGIPELSRLAVHAPYNTPTSLAVRRQTSRELTLNVTKLDWILSTREVHLSGYCIRAKSAIPPSSQPKALETLLVDRCQWNFSTCAGVVPQICKSVKKLLFVDLGLTGEQMPSWWNDPFWTQRDELPSTDTSSHVVETMLPSLYGLSRHISRLEIQYAPNCIFRAGPNLSLLSGDIAFCGVDYQGSKSTHPYMHHYPPNVKNLYVKLNQLDYRLFTFIEDLQDPDHLAKLETHPYIWIKVPWGSPMGLSTAAAERWETARKLAAETLAQRGLHVTRQPFELVERRKGHSHLGLLHEYSSFWCMSFSTPAGSVMPPQADALAGEGGADGSAAG